MTKDELNILNIFESGNTHAVYVDTDSVKTVSQYTTTCMYDYVGIMGIILKVLENV